MTGHELLIRFRVATLARRVCNAWWPPALRRSLYDWQQTADAQEWELAVLRRVRDQAQAVLDSYSARATIGHTHDVIGLAESLRRYREMVYGSPRRNRPYRRSSQSQIPFDTSADAWVPHVHDHPSWGPESARRFGG